jgi:hypothetical protein
MLVRAAPQLGYEHQIFWARFVFAQLSQEAIAAPSAAFIPTDFLTCLTQGVGGRAQKRGAPVSAVNCEAVGEASRLYPWQRARERRFSGGLIHINSAQWKPDHTF